MKEHRPEFSAGPPIPKARVVRSPPFLSQVHHSVVFSDPRIYPAIPLRILDVGAVDVDEARAVDFRLRFRIADGAGEDGVVWPGGGAKDALDHGEFCEGAGGDESTALKDPLGAGCEAVADQRGRSGLN